MRGKLFKHMFLVAMSVFVACTALFMWSLYSYFSEERQAEQRAETAYVAAAVEEGGKDFLQTKLPKDSTNRITWIDRDGTVLFDSVTEAEDMENHADRGRAPVTPAPSPARPPTTPCAWTMAPSCVCPAPSTPWCPC